MLVELLNVEAASSLVHVDGSSHWTVDVDSLSPVPLLGVQLTAVSGHINGLNRDQVSLNLVAVVT